METVKIFQIAKREWGNVRASLEKCGDIGEFDSNDFAGSKLIQFENLNLAKRLIEMDSKLSGHGYFTPEAAYVFTALVSIAGERLGLVGRLARTFGCGYGWVRTGCLNLTDIEEYQHLIKHLFFLKLFFPVGGFFNWDFNSPVVKTKLDLVFYKFITWQDNPGSYSQDVRDYRGQLQPLWRGLSLTLNFPLTESGEEYEIEPWVGHQI